MIVRSLHSALEIPIPSDSERAVEACARRLSLVRSLPLLAYFSGVSRLRSVGTATSERATEPSAGRDITEVLHFPLFHYFGDNLTILVTLFAMSLIEESYVAFVGPGVLRLAFRRIQPT